MVINFIVYLKENIEKLFTWCFRYTPQDTGDDVKMNNLIKYKEIDIWDDL